MPSSSIATTPVECILSDKGFQFIGFTDPRPWAGQMPCGVVIHSAPSIQVYSNAHLVNAVSLSTPTGTMLTGGAFTSTFDFIEGTTLCRGPFEDVFNRPSLRGVKFEAVNETLIYGGWHMKHFGHFLIDSLGSLWANEVLAGFDTAFSAPFGWGPSPAEQTVLDLLNVRHSQREVGKNLRVSRLIVSEPLLGARRYVFSYLGDFTRRLGSKCVEKEPTTPIRPIYISRRTVRNPTSYIRNEDRVEELFRTLGFDIVIPQDLSFSEQINLFNRAPLIAGQVGSYFHAALFSTKAHQRFYLCPPIVNGNFILTDAVSEGKSTYLNCLRKVEDKNARPVYEADLDAIRQHLSNLSP